MILTRKQWLSEMSMILNSNFYMRTYGWQEIFVVRKNLCFKKFGWIWVVAKVLQPWKEWAGHLIGLRQLDAQRQTFCPNFFPIWKASNSIRELLKIPHFGGGGGKSCSKTARSGVSNVGTRNLSNPGCDARNPGGGTKVAQLSFQFWSKEKPAWYTFSQYGAK